MICGCCKDLGCYAHGDTIKFGVISSTADEYIYHIWSNGTYTKVEKSIDPGEDLELEFTFNENSETTIKIEFPDSIQDLVAGLAYVTTPDGACCFTVHGMIQTCQ